MNLQRYCLCRFFTGLINHELIFDGLALVRNIFSCSRIINDLHLTNDRQLGFCPILGELKAGFCWLNKFTLHYSGSLGFRSSLIF